LIARRRVSAHRGWARIEVVACLVPFMLWLCGAAGAQELDPRAYAPNPVGVTFLGFAYGRSDGDIAFDSSSLLQDVHATIDSGVVAFGKTFGLFGHAASFGLAVPYASGDVSGNVGTASREVTRVGFGDTRLRFAVNLYGVPAMTAAEFARRKVGPVLGASLVVIAPTGEYDPDLLINVGANRWALKPEIGYSYPVGKWLFDAYAGAWFFTDNDDFFGGQRRSQDPLSSFQAHVSYTFRRGLWLAADATYYGGGATELDGVGNPDRQSNSRAGFTLAVPLTPHQSIKASVSKGTTVRIGGDFTAFGVAWQYTWID
jgi:hypothetical protein